MYEDFRASSIGNSSASETCRKSAPRSRAIDSVTCLTFGPTALSLSSWERLVLCGPARFNGFRFVGDAVLLRSSGRDTDLDELARHVAPVATAPNTARPLPRLSDLAYASERRAGRDNVSSEEKLSEHDAKGLTLELLGHLQGALAVDDQSMVLDDARGYALDRGCFIAVRYRLYNLDRAAP